MSDNMFDFERPALHFRRFVSRWYKRLKGLPFALADISVIHAHNTAGTVYEARRGRGGGWTVYRIYSSLYESGGSRPVYESLRLDTSLPEALDEMNARCPQCLGVDRRGYNHPTQIAKLIRHTFA